MTTKLSVYVPDKLAKKIEETAKSENRPIQELVVDALETSFQSLPDDRELDAMDREMIAYKAFPPEVLSRYLNQYVAVFNGEIVDFDSDQLALTKRRFKNFPNETVLITRVRLGPDPILQFRSPRLVQNN